jgi:peroxiredoxin Q/BCP
VAATVAGVLEVGVEAPSFTVPDQDGNPWSLADQRGKWVLLWWYPKADTPG